MIWKGIMVAFGMAVLLVGPLPQVFPYFNQAIGVALIGGGWYLIKKAADEARDADK